MPADPAEAVDVVAAQVAEERELAFTSDVDPRLLAPGALTERIVTLTREDYPADVADIDGRLLTALGAVAPGTDMLATTLDLLGSQVAGFYDPDTGERVAVDDDLDAVSQITLAHELDHALADQALGLPDLEDFEGRTDAALAAQAVVEGDATLLMQRWAGRHLSLTDQLAAATAGDGAFVDEAFTAGVGHAVDFVDLELDEAEDGVDGLEDFGT